MPKTIEKKHIKRTRGLWSKTMGVTYNILRAKGDLYHVNYLLQDCYIASKLGKRPLVGYSVGSDLRLYLDHWMWGRIVKHNLKKCDKIMVSTPDLISIAERLRKDVEYLPPAVDTEFFYPKPYVPHGGKKKVLIASNLDWQIKGTDIGIKGLNGLKNEIEVSIIGYGPDFKKTLELASSIGLPLNILPKVPHECINEYFWNADIVVDQFKYGVPGMTSLEAISCGRPALTYVTSALPQLDELPLKDLNSEEKIPNAVREIFANSDVLTKQQNYVAKTHGPATVINKLMKIYDSVTEH
jgi:glycosyltransferase involved in cell wall biosynthesis